MRDFGRCETIESGQVIAREQESIKFQLLNARRVKVRIIEVDDCFITEGLRCDWLFLPTHDHLEIYVELKGKGGVRHAIRQVEATTPQVSTDAHKAPKCCYVVSGGVTMARTDIQLQKARFRRLYSAQLKITGQRIATHTLA